MTTVSPLVHSPDEHSIAAVLSRESIEKVVAIQRQLKTMLGDAIWLTPANALHMTLMEIICDTEYKELPRKQHFMNWYERYNDTVKEIIAHFPSTSIIFNQLHVSPAAIILKAESPQPFNDIRDALLVRTVLPAQTKLPPDIAHCTIARFNKAVDLNAARERASAIAVDFDEHIREFKLMKDLGPDFNPSIIEAYGLSIRN
jgi:hypothetical protein